MSNGIDAAVRNAPWLNAAWDRLPALLARGAHAVLFHGPAGIGKKRLAVAVGSAALCEAPRSDGRACGQCAGCMLLGAGHHPDLRVVVPDACAALRPVPAENPEDGPATDDGAEDDGSATDEEPGRVSREIKLKPIQALADAMGVGTLRGGRRVVVIAPADALRTEAANALLKMLEEPPPATLFVLASDAPERMLPTILSRCLLVRVAAPAHDVARAWLAAQDIEDPEQRLAEAGGAPFAALEADEESLPAGFDAQLLRWLGDGARLDLAEVAASVPRTLPLRPAIRRMQRWGFDLVAVRCGAPVRYHRPQARVVQTLGGAARADALFGWVDALARTMATIDHPLNARHVIESALVAYREALLAPQAVRSATDEEARLR